MHSNIAFLNTSPLTAVRPNPIRKARISDAVTLIRGGISIVKKGDIDFAVIASMFEKEEPLSIKMGKDHFVVKNEKNPANNVEP